MTAMKKTLTVACATLALAGAMTISHSNDAEARWRRGYHGGAVAAGVVGALALGAIAASAATPTYGGCYIARRSVWSDYHGAYVVRRVRVCG